MHRVHTVGPSLLYSSLRDPAQRLLSYKQSAWPSGRASSLIWTSKTSKAAFWVLLKCRCCPVLLWNCIGEDEWRGSDDDDNDNDYGQVTFKQLWFLPTYIGVYCVRRLSRPPCYVCIDGHDLSIFWALRRVLVDISFDYYFFVRRTRAWRWMSASRNSLMNKRGCYTTRATVSSVNYFNTNSCCLADIMGAHKQNIFIPARGFGLRQIYVVS